MKKKILLTSGCSFTGCNFCWPAQLSESIDFNLLNVGVPSQGNDLISRKVIYNVEELLKTYKTDDILVGVMWSGTDRYNYYSENNISGRFTNIVNDNNWKIIYHRDFTNESNLYYEYFHTEVFSMIQTIEHIIKIQMYLDRLNIKYFMTTYMNIFNFGFREYRYRIFDLIEHDEIKYLYNLIDFSKFLPVEGCYNWLRDNYPNDGFNLPDENGYIDDHPSENGHKIFSNEIIIPFLKNKNLI